MKKIFTLFAAFVLIAVATQYTVAQSTPGTLKPTVSPNPAHDYIKVNWTQNTCQNVYIALYYSNGTVAKTLANRQYCDGIYSEMFKLAGVVRGNYIMKVMIGTQIFSYKVLIQ